MSLSTNEAGETEIELSDDPYDIRRLDVSRVPMLIALTKVGVSFANLCM